MRQHRNYSTEAVILKSSDLFDTDRILTLFTPNKGKFRVVAKGIRRPASKRAGHLDQLYHSQLHLAHGSNLDIITEAQTIESFPNLRQELWHTTCGFYLAELIESFVEEHTKHYEVYLLLLETLRALDADALTILQAREQYTLDGKVEQQEMRIDRNRSQLLMRYFEINLLSHVGYEPVFRTCAHCHEELQPEENGFNASLGGALCPRCSNLWKYTLPVNTLKVLRILQRSEWARVPQFRLDSRLHADIKTVMHDLLQFHLGRPVKSWGFLETFVK